MKKNTIKGIVVIFAVCILSLGLLCGCSSSASSSKSSSSSSASSSKTIDLTSSSASSSDVKAAFNTEDKNYTCEVKLNGKFEVKSTSNVIHLYINGSDYKESIYCDCSAISTLPETGAMVNATGTWKHKEGSSNDSAFMLYVSSIEVA